MKKLILALTLCLGSSNVFAGNEGPNAMAKMPETIARVQIGAMFAPPEWPRSQSVDVLATGEVLSIKKYNDGKVETESLAILGTEKLARLKSDIAGMSKGEVVDPNPQQDGCMDAPTTTYSAVQDGALTKIAQDIDCKHFRKKNMNMEDSRVISTLEALLTLAQ